MKNQHFPLPSWIKKSSALSALLLAIGVLAGTVGFAEPTIRLSGAIDDNERATIQGSLSPLASASRDAGPVPANTQFQGVSLYFSRSPEQEAAFQALLAAQQNPSSPQYHQWLTPDEYASRFGVAAADIAQVKAWLQQKGFSIDSVARSRNMIRFDGTVGQINAAFGTEIDYYTYQGQKHFAPSTALSIPKAMASLVLGVRNLDDFRPKPMYRMSDKSQANSQARSQALSGAKPDWTSDLSGDIFLAPGDIVTIYDLQSLYNSGYTGTGQSIAIMGQSAVVTSDIESFETAAGLPVKDPTLILVPGTGDSQAYSGDEGESDLDLEWSGAIAKGASIFFVYTGDSSNSDGVFSSLQYAVDERIAPVISFSYGACETDLGQADANILEQIASQGASQGQSIFASSGDSGSTGCYGDTNVTTAEQDAVAVSYPASSAYVTGVGGTEFDEGSGDYWNTSNSGTEVSSAISYIPEMVWNDDSTQYGLSASGGGVSTLITRPSWQTGVTGITSGSYRLVPDISLDASNDHDPYLFCTSDSSDWDSGQQSSCTAGFRDASTEDLTAAGGTSFAAPITAAIFTLINQQQNSTGQGLINPTLYSLAANSTTYASAFHDITVGNNNCSAAGSAYCTGSAETDYPSTTGYDLATGLGSFDGAKMAAAWPASAASKLIASVTSVTSSTTTPAAGSTVTFNLQITHAGGTATPTGTVTVLVDGGTSNSSNGGSSTTVTLAGGAATATATFSTSGNHIVVFDYSGDSNYAPSSQTTSLTVGGATTTTIVPSPSNPTVGGTVNFEITVAPVGTSTTTPTGTLSIAVDGTVVSTAAALSNGSYAYQTSFSTAGAHTITATYSGDSNYAASTGSDTVTVIASTLIGTTTAVTYTPSSPDINQTITYSVVVAATSGGGTPTGTVSFTADGGSPTTATLVKGIATFTNTFTTYGAHTVVASYSGDSNYNPSSGSATVTVVTPTFTVAISPSTVTIKQGSSGTATVSVTPANGYDGTIDWTLDTTSTALAEYGNACITDLTVSGTGVQTATLQLYTTQTTCPAGAVRGTNGSPKVRIVRVGPGNRIAANQTPSGSIPARAGLAIAGLLLAGLIGRRARKFRALAGLIFLATVGMAISGCGGSSSSNNANDVPTGTYSVTLVGTDSVTSSITSSADFTLVVD